MKVASARGRDYEATKNQSDYTDNHIITDSEELNSNFVPKRKQTELLAQSYYRLEKYNKYERCLNCGTLLEFYHPINECGSVGDGKLYKANFCKDRLCPLCSWRRSYKIFGQVSKVIDYLGLQYKYLFLTLTIPNCLPESLNDTIDYMYKSWSKFIRLPVFKETVLGWFRSLEVTRNSKRDDYHPHFHIVLAVDKKYSKRSSSYITHSQWLDMWRYAAQDDRITQVHIETIKQSIGASDARLLGSAIAEVAKYAVKSADYLFEGNESLTDYIVDVLGEALHGRRLCAFGGELRKAHRLLKLDDAENGDLVGSSDEINESIAYLICRYAWSSGAYTMITAEVIQEL